ncbi:Cutinase transcription factor 1 alpha [Coniochaeta hoffmannii]|uniref:Cutinase transcription factor 1 alpha n=1 Tax=Coniochaeta hoffmannii TaxID=91930 RepID=A0AA38VDQ3_9PEZI|nr:Cutinase transcription factor 1 alpha [Coniochaeta hoffmannii]
MAGQQVVGDHPSGQTPNGGRLRFVASDAVGLPVKRKQVQHACLACRQKKKKCNHGPEAARLLLALDDPRDSKRIRRVDAPPRSLSSSDMGRPSAPIDLVDEDTSTAASHLLGLSDQGGGGIVSADSQEEEDPQARFVGDLNPENILISAMAEVSRTSPSSHQQRDSAIGIWKEPVQPVRNGRNPARKPLPSGLVNDGRSPLASRATVPEDITSLEEAMRTARNNWLDRCLADIDPPQSAFTKLRSIYLSKIQPIFPIFDEKRLMNLGASRIDRAIKLVVSLAAATDREAKPHLRLEAYPAALSYQEFTGKVSQLVRALIQEIDFSNRLLDQIRILSLMAMYWQPLEEQDWDGPARLFTQAMSIVFSIGLHLEVYDKAYHIHDRHDETTPRTDQPHRQRCREDIERIFLCIFALDRMMASFHGRPILLAERDFDRDILKYAVMQPPIFRLFILVVWQLNLIQDLYRPFSRTSPSLQSAEVSVFERLILESGAQNAPPSLIATIEVFHHAVCALSVRQTRQAFEGHPAPGSPDDPHHQPPLAEEYPHLPQPLLNARRSISADRILQITKQYDVGPLPFIPYALSISLSVAYRKWRFSQIPMFRARGRAAFMEVLPVLEEWGRVFTSARINYNLAQKVVEGMEKVQDSIKRKCPPPPPVRAGHLATTGPDTSSPSATAAAATQSANNSNNNHRLPHPFSLSNANSNPNPNPQVPPFPSTSIPFPQTSTSSPSFPRSTHSSLPFPVDDDPLAALNLFNFFDDPAADLDVGLGEMDNLFDRNLDPMAPAFWPAYPSLDPDRIEAGAAFYP